MKRFILKIANTAILFGLLLTGYGLWDIYKERNVGLEASDIAISSLPTASDTIQYAHVSGGQIDPENVYEYTLSTKKSDVKLSSDFYMPVIADDEGTPGYILKLKDEPDVKQLLTTADYTGLLQSRSELPSKLLTAYESLYPGTGFLFLDTTYKPRSTMEKLAGLKIFFALFIIGLVVRLLTVKLTQPRAQAA